MHAFKHIRKPKTLEINSFKTWSGPTGRPGAGTGPSWRKNMGRKNPVWPGKTQSKTQLQPVDFFFLLLKRRRFNFFLKKINLDNLVKI
jgi:hypothetical protein